MCGIHGHLDTNVLRPRTAISRAPAQPHRSWVMTTNVMFALSWFGFAWYWHVLALAFFIVVSSLVLIHERQVGIVVKRFARRSLSPGRLIALADEAGLQA